MLVVWSTQKSVGLVLVFVTKPQFSVPVFAGPFLSIM